MSLAHLLAFRDVPTDLLKLVASFTDPPLLRWQWVMPNDMCLLACSDQHVVIYNPFGCVNVWTLAGIWVRRWTVPIELVQWDCYLAASPDAIYLSDVLHERIVEFSWTGQLVRYWPIPPGRMMVQGQELWVHQRCSTYMAWNIHSLQHGSILRHDLGPPSTNGVMRSTASLSRWGNDWLDCEFSARRLCLSTTSGATVCTWDLPPRPPDLSHHVRVTTPTRGHGVVLCERTMSVYQCWPFV